VPHISAARQRANLRKVPHDTNDVRVSVLALLDEWDCASGQEGVRARERVRESSRDKSRIQELQAEIGVGRKGARGKQRVEGGMAGRYNCDMVLDAVHPHSGRFPTLYQCVCVRVRVCGCVYVCVCVCVRARARMCICAPVRLCAFASVHLCVYVCVYMYVRLCLSVCVTVCGCVHASVCECVHVRVFVCICVDMSVGLCVCASVCLFICVYMRVSMSKCAHI